MNAMEWQTPYSYKSKRFYLFWYRYDIIFDDTIIDTIIGGLQVRKEVDKACAMLNGGYNLGYYNGWLDREMRDGKNLS